MAVSSMQILTTLIIVFVGAIFVTAVFPDVFSSSTALMQRNIFGFIPATKDLAENQIESLGNWTGGSPSCAFYNASGTSGSRAIGCNDVNTSSYMNFQFNTPSDWSAKTNISLDVISPTPEVNVSVEIRLQDQDGTIATFNITFNASAGNGTQYNRTSFKGLNLTLSSFTGWSGLNQSAIENVTFFPHFNFTSNESWVGNYTFDGIYVYTSEAPAFIDASLSVLDVVIILVVLALIILFVGTMMGKTGIGV